MGLLAALPARMTRLASASASTALSTQSQSDKHGRGASSVVAVDADGLPAVRRQPVTTPVGAVFGPNTAPNPVEKVAVLLGRSRVCDPGP